MSTIVPFTGADTVVEVEIELGDGVASRHVPSETIVEIAGSNPAAIVDSVNKAASVLAWDTRVLARLANSLIPLLERDPSLIDTIDDSVFDVVLAAAKRRVTTMPVGDMIEHLRGMQNSYGAESVDAGRRAAWQELDREYCEVMGR